MKRWYFTLDDFCDYGEFKDKKHALDYFMKATNSEFTRKELEKYVKEEMDYSMYGDEVIFEEEDCVIL